MERRLALRNDPKIREPVLDDIMPVMNARELYDQDFFQWTQCNAALLRTGQLAEIDMQHIAEELEDMGKREQRELVTRLRVLLIHLLKWQLQPTRRGASWEATIDIQRDELVRQIEQMPSLRNYLVQSIPRICALAARKAAGETGLAAQSFPVDCPFSLEQMLDDRFLPR